MTQSSSIRKLQIANPKRYTDSPSVQAGRLFSYYAGYSERFAEELLISLDLPPDAIVFDPWNGSGTTTRIAKALGHDAIGIDLNPAMVIVAKVGILSPAEWSSLRPIADSIVKTSTKRTPTVEPTDPLLTWFTPNSVIAIRAIEQQINCLLVSSKSYQRLTTADAVDRLSPLASFYYVALFGAVRFFLNDFIPSNPTWIKKPTSSKHRKCPSIEKITTQFLSEVNAAISKIKNSKYTDSNVNVRVGNAENIELRDQSIDAVISSPPYCTRIDYAVATAIELAVLGFNTNEFETLRRSLTGAATVNKHAELVAREWGPTCAQFLSRMSAHSSKASSTYYLKNHAQYFGSLYRSMQEISRVLTRNATCVLVAQTSHYKELLNDVPRVICDMAEHTDLRLTHREDFCSKRSMAELNKHAKEYLASRTAVESVLCFQRT